MGHHLISLVVWCLSARWLADLLAWRLDEPLEIDWLGCLDSHKWCLLTGFVCGLRLSDASPMTNSALTRDELRRGAPRSPLEAGASNYISHAQKYCC